MADKQAKAQKVYKTMVKALKGKNWHFEEHEQDLTIVSNYTGDDLPVKFIIQSLQNRNDILNCQIFAETCL